MRKLKQILAGTLLTTIASQASAHTFGAHGAGFAAGFAHPFMGLDHLLAMLAVGLWAMQLGGKARWAIPLTFVTMIAMGGLLAMTGIAFPFVETGIATSVFLFGALIALSARIPAWVGLILTGLFALFHGHAHGTELPQTAMPALYAMGFVAGTSLLLWAGDWLGMVFSGKRQWMGRLSGSVITVIGLGLLTAM